MRSVLQLSRPTRRGNSLIRLAATVVIAILILAGGATVMILNARDLEETLNSQRKPSETGAAQERPEVSAPTVAADALNPKYAGTVLVVF
jgi:hypothetical protein